ncbi:hypothetical protein [Pseudolactococcus insecticola]|uniref:Uncharacterized protein n=1 Tax=Pseudolactococcus insecticola TaxID=2709158 RepID=A0A6A0B949_9LACT|nr:hypothetical protein [Lactococcus insecticola]GFH40844.1 hypothetical protein Hs20B_12420 [Lactococcus insecticola]
MLEKEEFEVVKGRVAMSALEIRMGVSDIAAEVEMSKYERRHLLRVVEGLERFRTHISYCEDEELLLELRAMFIVVKRGYRRLLMQYNSTSPYTPTDLLKKFDLHKPDIDYMEQALRDIEMYVISKRDGWDDDYQRLPSFFAK